MAHSIRQPTDVTVAIPVPPFPPVFERDDPAPRSGSPWEELPKVVLSVTPDETLGDVLSRACTGLDLRVGAEALEIEERFAKEQGYEPKSEDPFDWLVYVGFRQPDDEVVAWENESGEVRILRRDQRMHLTSLVVRDSAGRATWRRPPFVATMAELFDADRARILPGSAHEIYLVPQVPQGDMGLLADWDALQATFKTLWDVAAAADRVAGALAFGHLVREVARRRRQGREVIEAHAEEWASRGAAPEDLKEMLALQDRSTEEVSALLGCSQDHAEAVLWSLGFSHDPHENAWRLGGDSVGAHIATDMQLGSNHNLVSEEEPETLQSVAERRLRDLAQNGESPSLEEEAEVLRARMRRRLGVEP